MQVNESGITTFAKEMQPAKARIPMWVTESGMVRSVKAGRFANKCTIRNGGNRVRDSHTSQRAAVDKGMILNAGN